MLSAWPNRFIPVICSRGTFAARTYARSLQTPQRYPLWSERHASTASSSRCEPAGDTFKLPSGRILGYHTSGKPDGVPVIYVHGNPDSGIQITGSLETKIAKKLGVRWIGPDRPGVGLSTMYDEQLVTDFPKDIECLVDHLALKEYYILGTSGGTGFALACARNPISERLKGVGICAGIGPIDCGFESMGQLIKKAWDMWRDHPTEMEAYIDSEYTVLAQDADSRPLRARIEADLRTYLADDELEHMLQKNALDAAVKDHRQIYAQGAKAHAKGIEFNLRPWDFGLSDIQFRGIKFWYGQDDVNTTPTMGRYMADRLPEAIYKEYPGKSHFTIWNEEVLEEMLRDLLNMKE